MKIRTDFVTNSSSTSYTCFTIKSQELADYLSCIRYAYGLSGLKISKKYGTVKIALSGGYGADSISEVRGFYEGVRDSYGGTDEQFIEVYGTFEEHIFERDCTGEYYNYYDILEKIIYNCKTALDERKIKKIEKMLLEAESVSCYGASFTSD